MRGRDFEADVGRFAWDQGCRVRDGGNAWEAISLPALRNPPLTARQIADEIDKEHLPDAIADIRKRILYDRERDEYVKALCVAISLKSDEGLSLFKFKIEIALPTPPVFTPIQGTASDFCCKAFGPPKGKR